MALDDLRGADALSLDVGRISPIVSDVARFPVTNIWSAWALTLIEPSG